MLRKRRVKNSHPFQLRTSIFDLRSRGMKNFLIVSNLRSSTKKKQQEPEPNCDLRIEDRSEDLTEDRNEGDDSVEEGQMFGENEKGPSFLASKNDELSSSLCLRTGETKNTSMFVFLCGNLPAEPLSSFHLLLLVTSFPPPSPHQVPAVLLRYQPSTTEPMAIFDAIPGSEDRRLGGVLNSSQPNDWAHQSPTGDKIGYKKKCVERTGCVGSDEHDVRRVKCARSAPGKCARSAPGAGCADARSMWTRADRMHADARASAPRHGERGRPAGSGLSLSSPFRSVADGATSPAARSAGRPPQTQ